MYYLMCFISNIVWFPLDVVFDVCSVMVCAIDVRRECLRHYLDNGGVNIDEWEVLPLLGRIHWHLLPISVLAR